MARRPPQISQNRNSPPSVSRDEIAREAFRIFQSRNGAPGDPVADWFQAEQTVKSRVFGAPTRATQASGAQSAAGRNAARNVARNRNRRRK
jgi:Protein of unknown function (DUF2934)